MESASARMRLNGKRMTAAIEIRGTVVAKGAPNRCKDGSTKMCSIVVSDELGLIRLYPLAVSEDKDIRIWSRISGQVRKSNTDQRAESFRVVDVEPTGSIDDSRAKADLMNSCVLRSGYVDPIEFQNERRRSICIVKSESALGAELESRTEVDSEPAIDNEDAWVMTQADFPFKPYIKWRSVQGVSHRTHICSQEVYMGTKHNASSPFRIFENLHVGDADYEHWLILGNMRDRRNVWVIAHMHRQKKIASATNTNSLTFDGDERNWPYSQQEAINARTVEPQRTFSFTT